MVRRSYAIALTLLWIITFLLALYYGYRQLKESETVDNYLISTGLAGLPISKETAVRVSDQVRRDFNVNAPSFVALKMDARPFLREDTGFLLTHKEGECGEGARVIVNLLNRLGFDATRFALYDRRLFPAHTLVSVVIGEKEFLVDSINSSPEPNRLLKTYDVSPIHFSILDYRGNIKTRTELKKNLDKANRPEALNGFLEHYWLYSYEAVPYTKLLSALHLNIRAFNLSRPPRWISALAEKPNMIMFLVTFLSSVLIAYLLNKLGISRTIWHKIRREDISSAKVQRSPCRY